MMNVSCKELRKRAWDKLAKGDYGNALGASFIGSIVGSAGGIFTSGAMMYGTNAWFLNLQRGKKQELSSLFVGFDRYVDTLVTSLLHGLFIFLWTLLLWIPGIIKAFSYSMTYFVMHDFGLSNTDAIDRSLQLMNGYKWKLFKLELSFIGWLMLCFLTWGIGALFLAPYMQLTIAEFYAELLASHNIQVDGQTADTAFKNNPTDEF